MPSRLLHKCLFKCNWECRCLGTTQITTETVQVEVTAVTSVNTVLLSLNR